MGIATFLKLSGANGAYVSTPDSVPLSILGNIDIRVRVAHLTWTPGIITAIMGKWGNVGQRSYALFVNTNGTLGLYWTENGTTQLHADSTVATGLSVNAVKSVRATLMVDNGATGRDIKFYTSDDGVSWTQLGTTVTQAGVTSIFDSNVVFEVGSTGSGAAFTMTGSLFRLQVRNNILDDGTGIQLDVDFSPQTAGAKTFVEGSSNAAIMTVNGGARIIAREAVPNNFQSVSVGDGMSVS